MFLWEAAPTLLSRKGYAIDIRRDCLALSLWLLYETHAAGDEKSLSPATKTPRHQQHRRSIPSSSGSHTGNQNSRGGSAAVAAAPNLADALSAENLVMNGGGSPVPASGAGDGGGNGSETTATNGVDAAAAAFAVHEQYSYRSAHVSLVRFRSSTAGKQTMA